MIYFRVKPEYDNKRLCRIKYGKYINQGDILIANELYTVNEYNQLIKNHVFGCDPFTCVEKIEISKSNIFWCFGARFQIVGG